VAARHRCVLGRADVGSVRSVWPRASSRPAASDSDRPYFTTEGTHPVQLDFKTRELTIKLVYYGPALSGKTTNLQ
jgi:hypothetical protein